MPESHASVPSGLPTGSIQFGGPVDRWEVALRVYGPTVDPGVFTALFGVQPTSARVPGAALPSGQKSRVGVWCYSVRPVDVNERDPNVLIRLLLRAFPSDPAVWATAAPHRPDVFCGLFLDASNRGCVLEPETLGLLTSRGLSLSLDIYAPDAPAA